MPFTETHHTANIVVVCNRYNEHNSSVIPYLYDNCHPNTYSNKVCITYDTIDNSRYSNMNELEFLHSDHIFHIVFVRFFCIWSFSFD